jgi:hypothetical protein
MPVFSDDVIAAVIGHMNDDHNDDNLLIARAFGDPAATSATMTTLDHLGGTWVYDLDGSQHELSVPWPGGEIRERPEIRREVVKLYDAACQRLGVRPRPHE